MSAEIFRVKNYKFKKFFSPLCREKFGYLMMSEFFELTDGFKNFKRMATLSAKKRIFKMTTLHKKTKIFLKNKTTT